MAEGRPVPTAENLIGFKVSGAGVLIGVSNGDPNCQQSDKEPKRSLFNGLAQVIVQSTKDAGEIKLTASADGLQSATATITAQAGAARPGQVPFPGKAAQARVTAAGQVGKPGRYELQGDTTVIEGAR